MHARPDRHAPYGVRRDTFVYLMFDAAGTCLYVGLTMLPRERWRAHKHQRPEMVAKVARCKLVGPFTGPVAYRIEREHQVKYRPLYNSVRLPAPIHAQLAESHR